jgi:arsenate reductase (glutaredoxin)
LALSALVVDRAFFLGFSLPAACPSLATHRHGDRSAPKTYVLIHNPGCGSSKKGLEALQAAGVNPQIRKYMAASERLSVDELKDIAAKMGGVSPRAFLREADAAASGLAPDAGDEAVCAAMAANPKLVQRPIGINGDRAVLGRPNARLLEIL